MVPGRPGPRELAAGPGVWIGVGRTPAGGGSPWHTHGDRTAYVYVLAGAARVEFGAGGQESVAAQASDLLVVPPGIVHREANAGTGESAALVVLVGEGEPMVPVDGPDV